MYDVYDVVKKSFYQYKHYIFHRSLIFWLFALFLHYSSHKHIHACSWFIPTLSWQQSKSWFGNFYRNGPTLLNTICQVVWRKFSIENFFAMKLAFSSLCFVFRVFLLIFTCFKVCSFYMVWGMGYSCWNNFVVIFQKYYKIKILQKILDLCNKVTK